MRIRYRAWAGHIFILPIRKFLRLSKLQVQTKDPIMKDATGTEPTLTSCWYHFSGATKSLSLVFGSEKHFFADSRTGKSNTAKRGKYMSIQETFVGNMFKCKNLNERLWIYFMID